jgi:hypothetical protein
MVSFDTDRGGLSMTCLHQLYQGYENLISTMITQMAASLTNDPIAVLSGSLKAFLE